MALYYHTRTHSHREYDLRIGRLVGRSLEAALLEWYRMSEFTGDRAALLVVQGSE